MKEIHQCAEPWRAGIAIGVNVVARTDPHTEQKITLYEHHHGPHTPGIHIAGIYILIVPLLLTCIDAIYLIVVRLIGFGRLWRLLFLIIEQPAAEAGPLSSKLLVARANKNGAIL